MQTYIYYPYYPTPTIMDVPGTGLILGVTPAEESVLFGSTISLSQWRYLRNCVVARMDSMRGVVERESWQRAPPPSMHVPTIVNNNHLMRGLLMGTAEKSQKVEKSLSSSRDKASMGEVVTVTVATPALKRFKINNNNNNNNNNNSSSSVPIDPETALRLHASLTSKQPRSRPTIHHPQSSSSSSSSSSSGSSSSMMMGVLSWSLDASLAREREPSRDGKYNHSQLGKIIRNQTFSHHDCMIALSVSCTYFADYH